MNGKSHEEIKEMLYDYAQGKLDAADGDAVRAHLAECPECATELEEIRETSQLLSQTYGRPAPESLSSSVMDEISRYEAASKKRKRKYAFMHYGSLAASFAVIILVAHLVLPVIMNSVFLSDDESGNIIQKGDAYDASIDYGGMLDQGGWDQDEYPEEEAPGFSDSDENPNDENSSTTASASTNPPGNLFEGDPSCPDVGEEYLFKIFMAEEGKKSEFLSGSEFVYTDKKTGVCVFRETESLLRLANEKAIPLSSYHYKDTIDEVRKALGSIPNLIGVRFVVVVFK